MLFNKQRQKQKTALLPRLCNEGQFSIMLECRNPLGGALTTVHTIRGTVQQSEACTRACLPPTKTKGGGRNEPFCQPFAGPLARRIKKIC